MLIINGHRLPTMHVIFNQSCSFNHVDHNPKWENMVMLGKAYKDFDYTVVIVVLH